MTNSSQVDILKQSRECTL